MVGAITYDAVRRWEKVPDTGRDELDLPEIGMLFATDLAVLDHTDGSLLLVANAVNYDATDDRVEWAWADAVDRLDRMTAQLAEPADSTVAVIEPTPADVTSSHTQEQFHDMVERSKEAIRPAVGALVHSVMAWCTASGCGGPRRVVPQPLGRTGALDGPPFAAEARHRPRRGVANTHVIAHAGRIMALVESGFPHERDTGAGHGRPL